MKQNIFNRGMVLLSNERKTKFYASAFSHISNKTNIAFTILIFLLRYSFELTSDVVTV